MLILICMLIHVMKVNVYELLLISQSIGVAIADSIEANVETAATSVEQGGEQLRQARKHQVTPHCVSSLKIAIILSRGMAPNDLPFCIWYSFTKWSVN